MAERDLKKYLLKRVKELGGIARKVRWEGRNSAPDWRVMLPDCPFWLELKNIGEVPTPMQYREMRKMREHGEIVYWANCEADIDNLVADEEFDACLCKPI